ncbi:CLUMA_CG006425, isoform A [Clunio marinus]|uniref:CLUMA_CG006425, isoform A n=1 Tax=Clunio marinus TaxID=568069 RepID=A0A1J1HZW2_9DIPT|nr:CLUMA_CG006425, isoform A [Clunio marinus]
MARKRKAKRHKYQSLRKLSIIICHSLDHNFGVNTLNLISYFSNNSSWFVIVKWITLRSHENLPGIFCNLLRYIHERYPRSLLFDLIRIQDDVED